VSRRRTLRIPIPWGHQPHTPPDDPFSTLVSEALDRRDCMAGFKRHPTRVCLLGQRSECAWGVLDRDAYCCMWEWIRLHPDGPDTQPLMAAALGQSRERIKSLCDQGLERARVSASAMSLLHLF
jgi:hypothetical protein